MQPCFNGTKLVIKALNQRGLAQKVAFLTPTGRVEKIYQQLTDFLGKANQRLRLNLRHI